MKKDYRRRIITCVLFSCLVLISLNMTGQDLLRPIQRPLSLSGNFGELRATHFHAGIDIRTGGQEGLPVICPQNGQLVRVNVAPGGYGQALYVEHPDGTTTVYGHLQRFVPVVSDIVRNLQYSKESFAIDENVRKYGLHFHRGDTIAYSGNSGASGGPHLHFEIRNTTTEHTFNPLSYYKLSDHKPPVVRMLYLYTLSDSGCVRMVRQCPVKTTGTGRYSAGNVLVPAGKIGIAVFAVDYMDESVNKLGIYGMQLTVAGDTLFRLNVDSCSFGQGAFINELKDFDRYKKRETVYRCFGNYQQELFGVENKNGGWVEVGEGKVVALKISLRDMNGNCSEVAMSLRGGAKQPEANDGAPVLAYGRAHVLELPGCRVELDSGALAFSVRKALKVKRDSLSGQVVFILAEKDIPLLKKGRLFIEGNFGVNAVICEVDASGRKSPVATRRTQSGLSADIGYLNRYTVGEDHTPPSIAYLGVAADRRLKFKIRDDFSGIATYRGEVDGQWCLFVYDAKSNLYSCSLNEPVFHRGRVNEVKVTVVDRVGNRNEVVVKVKDV